MRLTLGVTLLLGCASSRPSSWEEDASGGYGSRRLPAPNAVQSTTRSLAETVSIAPEPVEEELVDPEVVAAQLERSLLLFSGERRRVAGPLEKRKSGWPMPMETLWARMIGDLEEQLGRVPLGELPRRLLIQSRVTSEVEFELTEREFGEGPADLRQRLARIHRLVHLHMHHNAEINGLRVPSTAKLVNWPVSPVIITSFYGLRKDPVHGDTEIRFHSGIDLGGRRGDVIFSAAEGRVIHAGWLGGYGRAVIMQHVGGIQTLYGHLSKVLVSPGVEIDGGSAVGLMGQTGRATGPHLHFEVRKGAETIDPLKAVGNRVQEVGSETALAF